MIAWWKYDIVPVRCKSCGLCYQVCPADAIIKPETGPFRIDQKKCTRCGLCRESCVLRAVTRRLGFKLTTQMEKREKTSIDLKREVEINNAIDYSKAGRRKNCQDQLL